MPELTVMIPRPLVGEAATEYVALKAAPEVAPLDAPMSSVPVRLAVGVTPSAVNAPEKTATWKSTGLVA